MASSLFPLCALTVGLLVAGTAPAPRPTVGPPLPRDGQELCRRYRGELAGQPVVVEFTFRRLTGLPKEVQLDLIGRYYDLATGTPHDLRPVGLFKPAAPLTLRDETDPGMAGAVWHATQPLGPVLSGTWQASAQGLPQPFALREDYTGAARFERLTEQTTGRRGVNAFGNPARSSISVTYLHLLGADTLRPALARLQCPVPVRRRERHALDQVASAQDMANIYDQSLDVTLNEQDLLASATYTQEDVVDHRRAEHTWNNIVYDLRTGRQFGLLDMLRPGADTIVQRLITAQLRRGEPTYAALLALDPDLLPLPDEDFALTPAGCQATYQTAPEDEPFYAYTVTLTWAQLRPLLRSGTPLDRLLQARGLPPAK